jgi:hypothetical protein
LPTATAATAARPTPEQPEFGIFIYFSRKSGLPTHASDVRLDDGHSFFRIQFFELGTKLQIPLTPAGRNDFEGFWVRQIQSPTPGTLGDQT